MRACVSLACLVALALGLKAAEATAAELEWTAPAVCPDVGELRFGVERAIRMPLSQAAPLRFTVRAEKKAARYAARVVIQAQPGTPHGERELEAKDCARLADMVTVTVALALGAAGGVEDPHPRKAPIAAAVSSAEQGAPDTADPEPLGDVSSSSGEPWRPVLSAWFLGDAGSLPEVGSGAAFAAQLDRSWFGLRALGTLLFEQQRTLGGAQSTGPKASLGLLAGSLSACATAFGAGSTPVSASGCAGWELGRLSGQGSGVLDARAGSALWSAPRVDFEASLAFAVTGLRLGAMLTFAVPLVRDDFVLRDFGAVHRPSAVIGRAAVGLKWAL